MIEAQLKQIIAQAAQKAFGEAVEPEISPAEAQFGDFATNVAFQLAARLKQAPRALAEQLAAAVADPLVARAEAAGAGYVNLTLADSYWLDQLVSITPDYGKSQAGLGKKVQVEFISANPTGPLTMANARGGYPGDVVASVFARLGYDVTREYYVNDAGNQIKELVKAVRAAAGQKVDGPLQYSGTYIQEIADELDSKMLAENDDMLGRRIVGELLKQVKASTEKMGIYFDVWFSERGLIDSGQEKAVIALLDKQKLIYKLDEAIWLKSSAYGDERDRVLIKSTGEPVYLLNDLAYHLDIFHKRQFDTSIKVWGADHAGQVPSLKLTVAKLAPDKKLDFILVQLVRLMKAGKEVKMSKRAGVFVTLEELLEAIGNPDVARFFFLMRSTDSQMEFDLDLAREQSQKNPFWYLMYGYARAHSIMKKAKEAKLTVGESIRELDDTERQLTRKMSQLPRLLEEITVDYGVHRLAFYGREVAELFHDYYESEKIIDLPPEKAASKLYFVQRFIDFMDAYFEILGITPIEKM